MSVRLLLSRGPLCWIALAVIGATALGAAWGVCCLHSVLTEGFVDRSLAYAQAFSASTLPWVNPPNVEMLDAASRFMLVGSALYVQIVIDGVVASDERTTAFLDMELDPLAAPDTSSVSVGQRDLRGLPAHLDVVVPLPSAATPTSYVRIGVDESSLNLRKRSTTFAGIGIGLAIDSLLIGFFWWLLRRRHAPRPAESSAPTSLDSSRTVGGLVIDPLRRRVALKGQPVNLTPKQFALLDVLASQPERVFSDREIVEAVWSESPYADSKDVKQYIYLLRRRLSAAYPKGGDLIETVPGFGYRLNPAAVERGLTGNRWP